MALPAPASASTPSSTAAAAGQEMTVIDVADPRVSIRVKSLTVLPFCQVPEIASLRHTTDLLGNGSPFKLSRPLTPVLISSGGAHKHGRRIVCRRARQDNDSAAGPHQDLLPDSPGQELPHPPRLQVPPHDLHQHRRVQPLAREHGHDGKDSSLRRDPVHVARAVQEGPRHHWRQKVLDSVPTMNFAPYLTNFNISQATRNTQLCRWVARRTHWSGHHLPAGPVPGRHGRHQCGRVQEPVGRLQVNEETWLDFYSTRSASLSPICHFQAHLFGGGIPRLLHWLLTGHGRCHGLRWYLVLYLRVAQVLSLRVSKVSGTYGY